MLTAMAVLLSRRCHIAARCCACRCDLAWQSQNGRNRQGVAGAGIRRSRWHRYADLGTGTGVWLPHPSFASVARVKVVLDAMQTGPAVRTYNIMIGERRASRRH